jgi:hypothetical protein
MCGALSHCGPRLTRRAVLRKQPHTEAELEEIVAHYRERRLNPESFKKDGTSRKRKAAPRARRLSVPPTVTSHEGRGWPSNEAAPDAASVIYATEKPCASMIASLQPSRQDASNSSARRWVAGGLRLRARRRGLPTENIGRAYGTAMCESSRARSAENPPFPLPPSGSRGSPCAPLRPGAT